MATFRRKANEVQARRVRKEQAVYTAHGIAHALPGDWIISGPSDTWPIKDELFRDSYEPVDEEAEAEFGKQVEPAPAPSGPASRE